MDTGLLRWVEVQEVIELPAQKRQMLSVEMKAHSSLTTANHRWPVERRRGNLNNRRLERMMTTSAEFKHDDKIVTSAQRSDFPNQPKYTDTFVELVAWFWTEGSIRNKVGGVSLSQSSAVNPRNCERIRRALAVTFGSPHLGGLWKLSDPAWRERQIRPDMIEWYLNQHAGRLLVEQAPNRVVSLEFIHSLTQAQLDLFIEVSLLADGSNTTADRFPCLTQKDPRAAESFQIACVLAGHTTTFKQRSDGQYRVSLHRWDRTTFGTRGQWVEYDGPVWCVRTETGTWLAERNGTVYLTGNCARQGIPHSRFLSWDKEDQDKMITWVLEQRLTCEKCGTRHDEWDPEKGGDLHAYYAQTFTDFGCKVVEDAYDAARKNSLKDRDGVPMMNGVRVRLVRKETIEREADFNRTKALKEAGALPITHSLSFYPYP